MKNHSNKINKKVVRYGTPSRFRMNKFNDQRGVMAGAYKSLNQKGRRTK